VNNLPKVVTRNTLHRVPKSTAILGTSGNQSSTPMFAFDWQVMTCYSCSITTSGLSGSVVELQAVEVSRTIIAKTKKNREKNVAMYL